MDTGIGIAKDALAKLGRPFEQVENQHTRSHHGSGLGLAIAKSLVELHGGTMRIRSTLGRGTVVRVSLPAKPNCPLPKAEAA
jgi:two-component system cell cycle sensor histidine kinase PleC